MKITDKEALKMIKIVRYGELEESIRSYPEDERDGRSDMQFLADEVSYYISLYEEDGTVFSEDLAEAKAFMRESKNGTVIPCYATIPPRPKYTPAGLANRLDSARRTINEYRRLRSLMDRLNKKGYYGKW